MTMTRSSFHMSHAVLSACLILLAAGCGPGKAENNGNNGTTTPTSLTGVAATGAPIGGAQVEAVCENGAVATTATTAADGSYELAVDAGAAPCALRVTSGTTVFYSFTTTTTGTANITPLTDLVMGRAFQAISAVDAVWFAAPSDWSNLAQQVEAALQALKTALEAAGFELPPNFQPFTAAFDAQSGDPYDDLLVSIATSIGLDDGVADYAALRLLFTASQPLPTAPEPITNGLPAPTGDGAALGELDGATGTVGGETFTYTRFERGENVEWGAGNPERTRFNLTAFSTTADGTIEPLKVWRINGFPPAPGTYACGPDADLPTITLATGTTNYVSTDCTVEIISASGPNVEGRFSATFGDEVVTDGYFRVAPATGGGMGLPPGEVGASFDLDGQTYRYDSISNQAFETFEFLVISPSDRNSPGFPLGIQLNTIPAAPGTYACDQTYDGNEYRKVNASFSWNGVGYSAGQRQNPSPGPAGASCTITLTSAGDPVEGSFSGTFVDPDGASLTVTNGLFRHIAP